MFRSLSLSRGTVLAVAAGSAVLAFVGYKVYTSNQRRHNIQPSDEPLPFAPNTESDDIIGQDFAISSYWLSTAKDVKVSETRVKYPFD